MQGNGIPPSAVENTITSGDGIAGKVAGTTVYYDGANDMTVILDSTSGRVITIDYGQIKQ